jgi:hypothetical protein
MKKSGKFFLISFGLSMICLIAFTGCAISKTQEFQKLEDTSPKSAKDLEGLEYLAKIDIDPNSKMFTDMLGKFMDEMGSANTRVINMADAESCISLIKGKYKFVKVSDKAPLTSLQEYSQCMQAPIIKNSAVSVIIVDKNIYYLKTIAITEPLLLDNRLWSNFLIGNSGFVYDDKNVYFFADIYKTIGKATNSPDSEIGYSGGLAARKYRKDMMNIAIVFFKKNKINFMIIPEDMKAK